MSWEAKTLGEISINIQTGPFGSQLHQSDYSEVGTPVVMPKDLINGKISEDSIARVSKDHVERLSRHKIEVGDILYSRRGDVGRCAFTTEREKDWLCGTGCLRVTVDKEQANPRFVFFQLQKPETIGWVVNHAVGATMLNLNTSILSDVPVSVPEIEVQDKIVNILSAYDDLIENNQKQIKLLEEAAQRLYKEWFVNLHFPGYEDVKVVDGVPDGWEKYAIDDVYTIKYGKTLPTSKILKKAKYPVYGASKVIGYYNQKNCDDYTVLITSRGNAGTVYRTHHKESFITNNSFIVTPKVDYLHVPFVLHQMKSLNFKAITTGSCQPQLTNNSISMKKVLLPSSQILESFNKITDKYFERIEILLHDIDCLSEARDRLLPKLMSGELEV